LTIGIGFLDGDARPTRVLLVVAASWSQSDGVRASGKQPKSPMAAAPLAHGARLGRMADFHHMALKAASLSET
jgi:hypothetical protein